jgi:hypothetical protein
MVRAILSGRKTETRRTVKPQPLGWKPAESRQGNKFGYAWCTEGDQDHSEFRKCPYGAPGGHLWVRETWQMNTPPSGAIYRADDIAGHIDGRWRPSIFMPRWACRLTLEIIAVRVERLQEISEEDSLVEGIPPQKPATPWWQGYREIDGDLHHSQQQTDEPPAWMIEPHKMARLEHLDHLLRPTARQQFESLWNSLNDKTAPWASNPWVWVIEFKRIEVAHG